MVRRRTPREKKALSYVKDRRNAYGENDKGSRKGIPLTRSRLHRADRRSDRTALTLATGVLSLDMAERGELRVYATARRRLSWRKWPDLPLGDYVEWKRSWRAERQERGQRRSIEAPGGPPSSGADVRS
ncbi:hypothetical protein ACWEVD_11265 [Nocardia thailandica]